MGMFDLHMKLHRAIKFLGGVQTSTSHSLFHHVFSEMEKADFFEPLNVPGLNHAQESFGRVKAKNQWLVLQVNSMNTSPVPRNMPGHDLISYSRCSLSPLWDFLWVEDVGCRYSTLRVERMSLFLRWNKRSLGKSAWPSPVFRSPDFIRMYCEFQHVPMSCIWAHPKCKSTVQRLLNHFLRSWLKIFGVFTNFPFSS